MAVETLPTAAEMISGTQTNAQQKTDIESLMDFLLAQLGRLSGQGPETVASAATLNLDAVTDTRDIVISGVTAITAVTVEAGKVFRCRASGAFTLTDNAAIVTQRGANIVAAAGDTFIVRATAADTVEILCYTPASVVTTEKYVYVREEQAANTAGGTFTQGSYALRTINTEVVDSGAIASISANLVTLPAGTYRFRASAPAYGVEAHKCKLTNTTDAIDYLGTSEYTSASVAVTTRSQVSGRFTIAGAKAFGLYHRCQATKTGNGFGNQSNFGDVEVYSEIEFWKES
jgi:hypothetical protein